MNAFNEFLSIRYGILTVFNRISVHQTKNWRINHRNEVKFRKFILSKFTFFVLQSIFIKNSDRQIFSQNRIQ